MGAPQNLPKDAESYIAHVRHLATITNVAMDEVENKKYTRDEIGQYQSAIERLSDSVKAIANLRGDTDLFAGSRPEGLQKYQKEMYQIESNLWARLAKLQYQFIAYSHGSSTPTETLTAMLRVISNQLCKLFNFPEKLDTSDPKQQLVEYTHKTARPPLRICLNKTPTSITTTVTRRPDSDNKAGGEWYSFFVNDTADHLYYWHTVEFQQFSDETQVLLDPKDPVLRLKVSIPPKKVDTHGRELSPKEFLDQPLYRTAVADETEITPIILELYRIHKDIYRLVSTGEYVSKAGHIVTLR